MTFSSSFANFCNSVFHSRTLYPLLPPQSAVSKIWRAIGYNSIPISYHHFRMLFTANLAVSSLSSHANPAFIVSHLIDSWGERLFPILLWNHRHLPLSDCPFYDILSQHSPCAHIFFFFRINWQHGLMLLLKCFSFGLNIPKLSGTKRVFLGAFAAFFISLKAVIHLLKSAGHQTMTHLVSLRVQFLCQFSCAFPDPS